MGPVQGLIRAVYATGAVGVAAAVGLFSTVAIMRVYQGIMITGPNLEGMHLHQRLPIISKPPILPRVKLGAALIGVYTMTKTLQVAGLILAVPNIITYAAITSVALLTLSALQQKAKKPSNSPSTSTRTPIPSETPPKPSPIAPSKPSSVAPEAPRATEAPKPVPAPPAKPEPTPVKPEPKPPAPPTPPTPAPKPAPKPTTPPRIEEDRTPTPTTRKMTVRGLDYRYCFMGEVFTITRNDSITIDNDDGSSFKQTDSNAEKIRKVREQLSQFMDIPPQVRIICNGNDVQLTTTAVQSVGLKPNTPVEMTVDELRSIYDGEGTYTLSHGTALRITHPGLGQQLQDQDLRNALDFIVIPTEDDNVRISRRGNDVIELMLYNGNTYTLQAPTVQI